MTAWKRWKELSFEDKLELMRSEMFLTSAFNNLLFFGLLSVIAVVGPFTIFTIWIPAGFLLVTAFSTVEKWKQNNGLVEKLRGSVVAGVVAEQAERKAKGKHG